MATIYKISNDYDNKVYIGYTTRDPQLRFEEHYKGTSGSKSYIDFSMKKYGKEHFFLEILEENIPISKMKERERFWISYYDSYNKGYNLTPGGDGRSLTDEQINTIYDLYKIGLNSSEISKKTGIPLSTISHRILNSDLYDKEEVKKRIYKNQVKPITQYDGQTKEKIQDFYSISEAGRQLNIDPKAINAGLIHHHKVKDYYFAYLGEELIISTNKKQVNQYDLNGNFIASYDGAREAARQMGVNSACIIKACNGQQKTSKGYIWRYAE